MKKQHIAYILILVLVVLGFAAYLSRNIPAVRVNFEKEVTDPRMTEERSEHLYQHTWVWDRTDFSDNSKVLPKKPGVFTIKFTKASSTPAGVASEGQIAVTTDCNSFGATTTISSDNEVEFGRLVGTQKACRGSQEAAFAQSLIEVNAYVIDDNNELMLSLKNDYGAMYFKKK